MSSARRKEYRAERRNAERVSPKSKRTVTYTRPWLYPKQEQAIFDPRRYSLIEASTKTGKTVGCICWLFECAYMGRAGQNFWWIAPVFGTAEIAYRRMKAMLPAFMFESNEGKLTITLANGACIWFKSADKPDNLYGEDVYAAVIDEASRMKEEAFHAVRSTLTATRGPIRIIGNVKGKRNWFYLLCRKAEADQISNGTAGVMGYHKIVAHDAATAGVLSDEEILDAKRVLPDNVYRELYLAEASDDVGNPFGDTSKCIRPLSTLQPVAWGWDLAKSVDWTVGIGLDRNGDTCRVERFQRPWQDTIRIIKDVTKSVPALVDSTGVGDPVLEALQAGGRLHHFEGFKFTAPSKQQIMEGLAVAIQREEVHYPEGPVSIELDTFEYEYTRTGVRYSAPEGFHDDCVCALALAWKQKGEGKSLDTWRRLAH